MVATATLRRLLLRTRRHGKSHQGAIVSVCRSRQYGNHACQSATDVLLGNGLHPRRRLPTPGTDGNGHGARSSPDDSSPTAEDRRSIPNQRETNLDLYGFKLSFSADLSVRLGRSPLLKRFPLTRSNHSLGYVSPQFTIFIAMSLFSPNNRNPNSQDWLSTGKASPKLKTAPNSAPFLLLVRNAG
jgi:hypothetical protein